MKRDLFSPPITATKDSFHVHYCSAHHSPTEQEEHHQHIGEMSPKLSFSKSDLCHVILYISNKQIRGVTRCTLLCNINCEHANTPRVGVELSKLSSQAVFTFWEFSSFSDLSLLCNLCNAPYKMLFQTLKSIT